MSVRKNIIYHVKKLKVCLTGFIKNMRASRLVDGTIDGENIIGTAKLTGQKKYTETISIKNKKHCLIQQ